MLLLVWGIRGHLRCIGNVLFLFVSDPVPFSPILLSMFYYLFDPIQNPSCSLAHALFIFHMLSHPTTPCISQPTTYPF